MNILNLIGNTPVLKADKFKEFLGLEAEIFTKLEAFNPAGSVKDRVAKAMIQKAIEEGKLKKDSVIVEPTSGNTGIGLCMVASYFGYKTVIVMPENMSKERQDIMRGYGASLVLTPKEKGMAGAIEKATELLENNENYFMPSQFENSQNPMAHYKTTGPELYSQMDEKIDVLVCGVGTGGTISGTGKFLKEKNPNIKVIAVEPKESAVLSGKEKGPHGIQGIGAGFIPKILDRDIIDEIVTVSTEDARESARMFAKTEAFLCGISSGAALNGAVQIAKREEYKGKNIAVILPDGAEKYLSMGLFSD